MPTPTYRQPGIPLATHTMKNLCITGSVQSSLERFANMLKQAGATPALPANRNQDMTMATWHRKVLAIHAARDEDLAAPPTLGRAWEQMAGDIYLANHEQPVWFWAERGSNQLLDFWHEFDPQTFFLFVYDSPVSTLSAAIEDGARSLEELQKCLEQWTIENQQMLRFHLRHPTRSLLVDSQTAVRPQACLEFLTEHWALPLDTQANLALSIVPPSPFGAYLIEHLLQENSQVQALHSEIQACLKTLDDGPQSNQPTSLDQAFTAYLDQREVQQEAAQQSRHLTDSLNNQKQELHRLTAELNASQQNNRHLDRQLKQSVQQQQHTLRTLKDCEEETQLLLEQLHQTQEELEQQIIQNRAQAQRLDEQATGNSTTLQRIATLENEAKALVDRRDQLQQLADQLQQQLDALGRENVKLTASRDDQAKLAAEGQARVGHLQTQLAETESENDLILLQLHETQEELEQYLLQHQANQGEVVQLRTRLTKLLAQLPDYWDAESIDVTPQDAPAGSKFLQWRLTNIDLGERLIPELIFKTTLTNGLAGIIIQRSEGSESPVPLLRWPGAFAAAQELPCVPVRGHATEGNNAALTALGSSDWQLLQRLVRCLLALLSSPDEKRLPSQLDRESLCQGLTALQHSLVNWPTVLRYDTIELHNIQQFDTYRSLELRLTNLQLGQQQWPALDYRLATVDPEPGDFGQNPRLEFPASTRAALQSWFAESDDERGARLELRFARPDVLDTLVWNVLSAKDQLLIAGLLATLPLQLVELQQANPTVPITWRKWRAMVESLRNATLARHQGSPRLTVPAKP